MSNSQILHGKHAVVFGGGGSIGAAPRARIPGERETPQHRFSAYNLKSDPSPSRQEGRVKW